MIPHKFFTRVAGRRPSPLRGLDGVLGSLGRRLYKAAMAALYNRLPKDPSTPSKPRSGDGRRPATLVKNLWGINRTASKEPYFAELARQYIKSLKVELFIPIFKCFIISERQENSRG